MSFDWVEVNKKKAERIIIQGTEFFIIGLCDDGDFILKSTYSGEFYKGRDYRLTLVTLPQPKKKSLWRKFVEWLADIEEENIDD